MKPEHVVHLAGILLVTFILVLTYSENMAFMNDVAFLAASAWAIWFSLTNVKRVWFD